MHTYILSTGKKIFSFSWKWPLKIKILFYVHLLRLNSNKPRDIFLKTSSDLRCFNQFF